MVVLEEADFFEVMGTPGLKVMVGGAEKVLSVVIVDLALVFQFSLERV